MYNLQILQKSLYERNSHKNCQMAKRAWVCVQADEHGAFITKRTNISLDRLYSNNHKLPSGDAFSVHSSVSTIEGNFLQNDCHLGEGSVLVIYIYIIYNLFKCFLSLLLSNFLPLSGQPYANNLWKRWFIVIITCPC